MLLSSSKPIARDLISRLLYVSGVTQPDRTARGQLTIVTFHRVLPQALRAQYPLSGLVATPEELVGCLNFFTQHFVCGTLRDMAEAHASGHAAQSPRLAVTFDDGQRDSFVFARPLLEERGLRASFFVPVEAIGTGKLLWHDRLAYAVFDWYRNGSAQASSVLNLPPLISPYAAAQSVVDRAKTMSNSARLAWISEIEERCQGATRPQWDGMMTWDQIRALHRAGHEIGSHSMTHQILTPCSDAELEYEVRESRDALARQLDTAPVTFCYPNGDHDDRTVNVVRRAGYRWGVTTRWGLNSRSAAPLALHRIDIDTTRVRTRRGNFHPAQLAWRLSGLR